MGTFKRHCSYTSWGCVSTEGHNAMSDTEEFGGVVYMDESLDPNAASPILTHSRLFPLSLLVLPVVTLVLVFVAPVVLQPHIASCTNYDNAATHKRASSQRV